MPRSVVDLSAPPRLAQLLERHGLRGESWGFPTHLWRCVALAPRESARSASAQALTIAAEQWSTHDLMLFRTALPELEAVALPQWRARAIAALSQGLAYPSEDLPAIAGFVDDAMALVPNAELLSNQSGDGSWNPLTSHTFDLSLVAANAAHLLVILVVDED